MHEGNCGREREYDHDRSFEVERAHKRLASRFNWSSFEKGRYQDRGPRTDTGPLCPELRHIVQGTRAASQRVPSSIALA